MTVNKTKKSKTPIAVGFQGVFGAYSQLACEGYFAAIAHKTHPYPTFKSAFQALIKGKIRYAVLPIENSLAGSIVENYDLLQTQEVTIVGEYKLRVHHCLLGLSGAKLKSLKKIFSHPQALAQCSEFIESLEDASAEAFFDTAAAAKQVFKDADASHAAIASELAAETYGLKILRKSIENNHRNITRFVVIQKSSKKIQHTKTNPNSKSSMILTLKSIPGALHKALSIFAIRDIDLLKIESRPVPGKPWQYRFFIDCNAHIADDPLSNAMRHLAEISEEVKFLGSYKGAK